MSTHLTRIGAIGALMTLALVLGAAAGSQQQAASRLAYVNMQAVMAQTPEFREADSILNAEADQYRIEMQRLQQELDSAVQAFSQQEVVLSPSARQAKQQELIQMRERAQQRASELDNRIQVRQQQLLAPIELRIDGILDGIRAERNLAFIFDVSPQAAPIIVAADRTLDITPLVIQRVQGTQ